MTKWIMGKDDGHLAVVRQAGGRCQEEECCLVSGILCRSFFVSLRLLVAAPLRRSPILGWDMFECVVAWLGPRALARTAVTA